MTFVHAISDEEATGAVADLFDADRAAKGYVPNYSRLFGHRPAVYAAWGDLNRSIKTSMGVRAYELATIAAARRLRSSYCMLAHGTVLAEKVMPADAVRDLVTGAGQDAVDERESALMDLADRVVADATAITQEHVDRLRELGASDDDIIDTVLAAAARCFFSKVLDALGVQPDAEYAGMPPELRDVLTVGRPIATA